MISLRLVDYVWFESDEATEEPDELYHHGLVLEVGEEIYKQPLRSRRVNDVAEGFSLLANLVESAFRHGALPPETSATTRLFVNHVKSRFRDGPYSHCDFAVHGFDAVDERPWGCADRLDIYALQDGHDNVPLAHCCRGFAFALQRFERENASQEPRVPFDPEAHASVPAHQVEGYWHNVHQADRVFFAGPGQDQAYDYAGSLFDDMVRDSELIEGRHDAVAESALLAGGFSDEEICSASDDEIAEVKGGTIAG